MRAPLTLALVLTTLSLSSCGSMQATNETLVCIVACVHMKSTVNKKGPDEPGLKTKSTQDFSDPEKDGAPEADRKQDQPVRP